MSKSVDQEQRLAALSDLRRCLTIAEEIGELEVVEGADPHLEMGALYELSLQKPVPPVLLFRKIKGYPGQPPRRGQCALLKCVQRRVGLELVQNYRKHRRKSASRSRPSTSPTAPCSKTC